jgi:hypothetical protein
MSTITNIDQEWENFMNDDGDDISTEDNVEIVKTQTDYIGSASVSMDTDSLAPKSTNLYISTKTQISHLNLPINIKHVFWNIPVINYYMPTNGVIKKQMKFNSTEKEEVEFIKNKIQHEPYVEEHILTHIDNPDGRIKFKDIRKVSIGISKKDILSYRCKKKSAFYNCFVIILRMKVDAIFKEFHIKVFNTGEVEIPGIKNDNTHQLLLNEIHNIIQPYIDEKISYKPGPNETILINSNFKCGFFINREEFYDILKYKYNIQAIYDPCSYPGIQCKFYYNADVGVQNGCQISEENKSLYKNIKKVSFMIFRTGSVLIVGKCDESVLHEIYEFIKIILNNEYKYIYQKQSIGDETALITKNKIKKARRKIITIEFNLLATI